MRPGTLLVATKGLADKENLNIFFMKGDVLKFLDKDEDDDYVFEVIRGVMHGLELNFKAKTVVEYFEYYTGDTAEFEF